MFMYTFTFLISNIHTGLKIETGCTFLYTKICFVIESLNFILLYKIIQYKKFQRVEASPKFLLVAIVGIFHQTSRLATTTIWLSTTTVVITVATTLVGGVAATRAEKLICQVSKYSVLRVHCIYDLYCRTTLIEIISTHIY